MSLKDKLYFMMELVAPQSIADDQLRLVSNELLQMLQSPTRTIAQLESLLYKIKRLIPLNPQSESLWDRFEDTIFRAAQLRDTEEMDRYLSTAYVKLQELLQSPRNLYQRPNSYFLNKDNLDSYNDFNVPIGVPSIFSDSFETMDRLSDRRSMVSSHYTNHRGNHINNNGQPLRNLVVPFYRKMVPEEEILRNISYTLLGIESDMFPFENDSIKIPYNIPNADSGILHLIFEAGLIYKSLSQDIENYRKDIDQISPMKKALLMEVEKNLNNYTGFINTLFNSGKATTLKALYLELSESINTLRLYYRTLNQFENITGDKYLSNFYSNKSHGDPSIRAVSKNLYESLLSLYFEYLTSWLLLGKLETTTFNEFFIEKVTEEENSTNTYIPYKLVESKNLSFFPIEMTRKVYMIGKTYIFITKYCNELQWSNDFTKRYSLKYQNLSSPDFIPEFYTIIREQYTEVVRFTNEILRKKFYFTETIHMLKNILLMGKNDLIDMIILKGKDILNEPSSALTSYTSSRILQDAVQQSSFRNWINRSDNNSLINRLDARVLNLTHGSLGWDVFTLEYIVHEPLSVVLNVNRDTGRKEYLRIFNFLWKFKRNDFFYNNEMLRSKELIRSFKKFSLHSPLARDLLLKLSKFSILRSQLQQFNYKIESYYLLFIIEKAFDDLDEKLKLSEKYKGKASMETTKTSTGLVVLKYMLRPNKNVISNTFSNDSSITRKYTSLDEEEYLNIDQIEETHNTFLNNILSHRLLSSDTRGFKTGQSYAKTVLIILHEISNFILSYSNLNSIAHSILLQLNLQNNEELNDLIAQFNSISTELINCHKNFEHFAYYFIYDLKNDNDESLNRFARMLR
ncbi:hypothetical protein KAFR_0J02140 [Kazachstania africana CBS 2517]|uniref:Spindle pole body component n=1 Tax=Kazachstania africana (strain ATCC 22294 / BCRC 22015 / CBS 2517 / CECT 1963 / NBRC 1671 / NRRL Y-8276) TaxID=1071382 RepID=H2B0X8_KAZAF|nr:hypothetical protein KAFR_0J02140 [Kazachstania africana CBS 2517]CCF60278.1 hypothetical protein KAFR_0J02140 [Kazachstania africana CBS 2517]